MYQGIVEKDQYLAENVKGKVVMDVDVNQGMFSILAVEMPVRVARAFDRRVRFLGSHSKRIGPECLSS